MSRADINLKNNFSNNNQNQNMNFDDFDGVWQDLENVSEISFELLLPKDKIEKKEQTSTQHSAEDFWMLEENLMRQNLVNLAINENTTVKQNKENGVNLLVKAEDTEYTKSFLLNLPQMTEDDIRFFQLLAEKQNININNHSSIVIENNGQTENLKNLNFSKSFLNLIQYSLQSQRPIRIDFAENASVILRISRQGRVSAEFISSDKAMEYLLRTNIPKLKQKLDSSGIKYKKIYYRNEDEE